MISIVCVYNNERIYSNVLLKSLENQSAKFELITLDNRDNKYKSAAEALNHGGLKTKGEFIMFVHQDVFLGYSDWMKDAETFLNSLVDPGVAGVAGVGAEGGTRRDRFKYSVQFINKLKAKSGNITKPEVVQTLDECVLIVPRSVFEKVKFDDTTFDGWDCYGTDYCLSVKKLGLRSYVLPLPCSHSTMRSRNKIWEFRELFRYQKKLYKKHKTDYNEINTWMGNISWVSLKIYQILILLGPLYSRLLFHSSENIWEKELYGCESILDLGCGWNSPVKHKSGSCSIGIDFSGSSLQESRRLGIHDNYIQADLNKIEFKKNSFDVVIAVNVLEYLGEEAGSVLLEKMEKWAVKKVIVVTQNRDVLRQSPAGNSLGHKSIWSARDFMMRGFTVRGLSGWKGFKDYGGYQKFKPAIFWERISELTQNIIFYFPDKASRLFAIKKIDLP